MIANTSSDIRSTKAPRELDGRSVMDPAAREAVHGDCGWLVVAGASRNDNGQCEEDCPIRSSRVRRGDAGTEVE
jgi:hypothetical protein